MKQKVVVKETRTQMVANAVEFDGRQIRNTSTIVTVQTVVVAVLR